MNANYRIIIVITSLLVILSMSISGINYVVSLKNAQSHLKNQSLPLSLDNIYSSIQKNIIEPYLVSSMMANDTFVHDWLNHEESNQYKIIRYLESIKNKYNMFNTFLVSDRTKKYYTPKGFMEKVKNDNPTNEWYFKFKNIPNHHEINLDFNKNMSNEMMMFINYKIFDSQYHYIGATGVAIQISYIDEMLKNFRVNHKFQVTFFDKNGKVVLAERNFNKTKNLNNDSVLKKYKDLILSKTGNAFEYKKDGEKYIVQTKYIPELELYLMVKANLNDFIKDVQKMFYLNLFISIMITVLIAYIVFYVIRKYSSKLEYLSKYDSLTSLSNRGHFEENFQKEIDLSKRKRQDIGLLFIDIDNFKDINDTQGHQKGDLVLQEVALILKNTIRGTDLITRWGGEEFVIVLLNSSLQNSKNISEKLRTNIEKSDILHKLISEKVTISIGLTMLQETDTLAKVISRADEAMYLSKNNGKNQLTVL